MEHGVEPAKAGKKPFQPAPGKDVEFDPVPSIEAKTKPDSDAKTRIPKSRVQFDLPPRSMDRLNALKLKTEAASYAEVLKNAFRLYEALIEETEKGNEFLIRSQDGTITPYRMFLT